MKSLMTLITILFFAASSFAAEISEREVKAFLGEWLVAQNTGSYSNYADLYSNSFVGIKRSGLTTTNLNHDAWLKDRKKMFKKKMAVTVSNPLIQLSGATALVKFEQTWESGTYKDKGDKVLNLALENGKLRITREEMLFSKAISNIDVENSEISTVATGTTPDGAVKYTTAKYKDCWEPKGYFPKHYDFDEYTKECPGLKGWRLFQTAGSERSWLEIAKEKRLWSTQDEVTGSGENKRFGQMQDLGDLANVEWRLKSDGTPIALIFKVQATDPNSTERKLKILYRYYVIGLFKGVPQFCGAVKTSVEARKIANNPVSCSDLEERKINP